MRNIFTMLALGPYVVWILLSISGLRSPIIPQNVWFSLGMGAIFALLAIAWRPESKERQ